MIRLTVQRLFSDFIDDSAFNRPNFNPQISTLEVNEPQQFSGSSLAIYRVLFDWQLINRRHIRCC